MQFTPLLSTVASTQKPNSTPQPSLNKAKRYVSRKVRQELLLLWESSGGTQVDFCHTHNLRPKTFAKWLKEAKLNAVGAPQPSAIHPKKPVLSATPLPALIQIHLPNGVQLKLPINAVSSEHCAWLKELCTCKYN